MWNPFRKKVISDQWQKDIEAAFAQLGIELTD